MFLSRRLAFPPGWRQTRISWRLLKMEVTCVPEFWLSLGWNAVKERGWDSPLYWEKRDGKWFTMTLVRNDGTLVPEEPVCHVSFFEADAYARWSGAAFAYGGGMGERVIWIAAQGKFRGKRAIPCEATCPSCLCGSAQPNVWGCLGVDTERLLTISGIFRRAWRPRRIQRQVHVQSIRSPRRFLRHLSVAYPSDLSKFFPAGRPLAIHGNQTWQRTLYE